MSFKPRFIRSLVLLAFLVGCAISTHAEKPNPLSNGQTNEVYQIETRNPVIRLLLSVEKSLYSFLCIILHIFPASLGKAPLKLKFLRERMVKVGLPSSCSEIMRADYGLSNNEKLKRILDEKNIPLVWVLGGPGSGKGTLCTEMANREGLTHISAGEKLRTKLNKNPNSFLTKIVRFFMTRGLKIPDLAIVNKFTVDMVAKEMLKRIDNCKGFLIDGFPRTLGPAKMFQTEIRPPDVIISLEVSDETLEKRLLNRNDGRPDDNEEAIKNRIKAFHEQTELVIKNEMFKSNVKKINGEGSKEEVFDRFSKAVREVILSKSP